MAEASRNTFNCKDVGKKALEKPVLFHIIHVSNISKSRLNQLDEWKEFDNPNNVAVDRLTKSRKIRTDNYIIREVNMEEDAPSATSNQTGFDTYKLLLRDSANNYCYGYEFKGPLPFLRTGSLGTPLGVPLGGRLVVKKGTLVQNGVLLLTRQGCDYLGVDSNDTELINQLNDGVVQKYIAMLEAELKAS
ncbi:uncharacterized protein CANTADRAFT_44223 [Suhomyces tanzawaensis NRRL Y-17324]|uniref:RecQ mediated genome instability protein 1 OB-fold domain-containing protein n=1 Tax=Suhomyces tanzawaensis NRRL Y-17324 TaxID=984487 RepID=A0A1E4SSF4_9ASCO|nr:uncharacterized protein CANTADRAFT_44223 [Suhomyces tanzawaensis NRRL Y-17324]ODV82450.1 hypothetical protein CANTADRAFT_44223 [Suhomyces tanzawaensis NRRL Y-17324]